MGSGYEVRVMVECLNLPVTLGRFPSLSRLEFLALAESPILTLSQGISTQAIINSIALRCADLPRPQVRCWRFHPRLPFAKMNAVFLTLRAAQPGDINFLRQSGFPSPRDDLAAGCLLNQLFDANGLPLLPEDKVNSVTFSVLRAMTAKQKPVIALNSRYDAVSEQAKALSIACRSGLVNGIVVHRLIAEEMLQLLRR